MIKQRKRSVHPANSDQSVHMHVGSVLAACVTKPGVISSQLSTVNNPICVNVEAGLNFPWVHRTHCIKHFFMLNSIVHHSSTAHNSYKTKMLKKKIFLNFRPSEVALIMLIIVGILAFMSMINFIHAQLS